MDTVEREKRRESNNESGDGNEEISISFSQFLPPPPKRGKEWPSERAERGEKSTEERSVAKRTKNQRQRGKKKRKRNSMAIKKIPHQNKIHQHLTCKRAKWINSMKNYTH